jgi:hypothetical protein
LQFQACPPRWRDGVDKFNGPRPGAMSVRRVCDMSFHSRPRIFVQPKVYPECLLLANELKQAATPAEVFCLTQMPILAITAQTPDPSLK